MKRNTAHLRSTVLMITILFAGGVLALASSQFARVPSNERIELGLPAALVKGAESGTPVIRSARLEGKNLEVTGDNFDPDAEVFVNGERLSTKNKSSTLIGKKGRKKLPPNRIARLAVQNSSGLMSEELTFFTGCANEDRVLVTNNSRTESPVEGFGSGAVGGTGGAIYMVTNLSDDGPCSLRDLLNRPGPKTIKFAVSGIIDLASDLNVTRPFLTIDGSDAPNGGICLRGGGLGIGANEVIVRYIRIRPGPDVPHPGASSAIGVSAQASNVVIDHCSLSWSTDENLSIYGHKVTVQWSVISEGLNCAGHPEGCHSMGILVSGWGNVSLHHNLLAHHEQRNPAVQKNGIVEWVNNVIYNGNMHTVFTIKETEPNTNIRFDAIGNYYKEGANGEGRSEMEKSETSFYGTMTLYVKGNIGPRRTSDSQPEQNCVKPNGTRQHIIASPHVSPPQVGWTTALEAYDVVLSKAGATYPCRDSADDRIINEVTTGAGRVINNPNEVGGWPNLNRSDCK